MQKLKALSLRKKIIFVVIFLVVTFLVWLMIRVISMDTKLETINLYQTPSSSNLENIYNLEEGDWAAAIDGTVVAGKSFEQNEIKSMSTASTIKMVLALAVMQKKPFELGEQGETIVISENDYNKYLWYSSHGGSFTPVQVGEEISEYDALVSVLLASSNNMAETLAEWAFGSIDAYRESAAQLLSEIGVQNTVVGENITGYDTSSTSTASDLAVIGDFLLNNPVLKEIVGTKSYDLPVAGTVSNTNGLLGINNIIGIKTGHSGAYNLVAGYIENDHNITTALLGASTREKSFNESLEIIKKLQEKLQPIRLVAQEQTVGYLESWWTGQVAIKAEEELENLVWDGATAESTLLIDGDSGTLEIKINKKEYPVRVRTDSHNLQPSLWEKIKHAFGWKNESKIEIAENLDADVPAEEKTELEIAEETPADATRETTASTEHQATNAFTNAKSANCTISFGALMLINPNFTVEDSFISARRGELVSISSKYGIVEGNPGNGDNLLDAEAAVHINDMVKAYEAAYPGHTLETRSCFRSKGTQCGRLCAATGTSDHHTGLTCDLLDPAYGTSLDTDTYSQHIDWQWLKANSYKYGFIDRFPEAWAGGSMNEPLNVDANGTTGLFETWHYRYVGIGPATEIATGVYNNGQYDSLEHYLKARGMIKDLKAGTCN